MKLKKLIASMCGIAMLSATFAAFSVSASASMAPSITLASGTTAATSAYQYFDVKVTGQSATWTSGVLFIGITKGAVTATTFKAMSNEGVNYDDGGDPAYVAPTKGLLTASKAGTCVFDDTKYDVMGFSYASAASLVTGTDDLLFEIRIPVQAADIELMVMPESYLQQDNDNTVYNTTTAKTYTMTKGTDTVAEKASSTTASSSPYDMTKLGLYTNPDNAADQAVAWTVSVKADGSYDQVNYKVTDNSVSKTTGEQALTDTAGGGDVKYGLAVGWLGSGSTPVNPSATATFSKKG